jgi:hypothetical protein
MRPFRRAFSLRVGPSPVARELDDELAFHLDMRTKRLIESGMTPDAARQEALRQFGDVQSVRDDCLTMDEERDRAMQRANMLDEMRQDLTYAVRVLRRNLGFTITVVLTLALGIGANTAIFTLVNAVLLRPLAVRAPEQLVGIGNPTRVSSMSVSTNPEGSLISYPLYKELIARNTLTSGLLASGRTPRLDARIDPSAAEPEHPRGRFVSGNYFDILGISAHRGRVFTDADDRTTGAAPVVTISYAYWIKRFDGAPSAVGRTITMNGVQMTITGVTPPSFTGEIVGQSTDVWIPLTMQPALMPNEQILADWSTSWLLLLGRLQPGVTHEQATAGFTALINQVLDEHFPPPAGVTVPAREVFVGPADKGFSRVRGTYRVPLLTLMIGAGLLLLIICANIANLLLARAVGRSREIGVRLAIGAGRARLVRQLLTESLLLAVLSAAAALFVAWWGSRLLLSFAADGAPTIPLNTGLDLPVLAFTLVVSIVAVVLFGLVPALRASRVDLASTMRANAQAVSGGLGARGVGRTRHARPARAARPSAHRRPGRVVAGPAHRRWPARAQRAHAAACRSRTRSRSSAHRRPRCPGCGLYRRPSHRTHRRHRGTAPKAAARRGSLVVGERHLQWDGIGEHAPGSRLRRAHAGGHGRVHRPHRTQLRQGARRHAPPRPRLHEAG